MEANETKILVDFRESRSKVPEFLVKMGIVLEKKDLSVDYIIGKGCFIERKTVIDFISSIADGRIFRQVAALSYNYENPLVVLEGGGLYNQGHTLPNAIRGVMLWIAITKKVPLIRTYNEYDTACILCLLAKHNPTVVVPHTKLPTSRKITTPWQKQMDVLRQVPGIGWKTSKDLLGSFGSLSRIIQASDVELLNVDGLGEEKVKAIRKIFTEEKLST